MKHLLFGLVVVIVMLVLTDMFFLHGLVDAVVTAVKAAI